MVTCVYVKFPSVLQLGHVRALEMFTLIDVMGKKPQICPIDSERGSIRRDRCAPEQIQFALTNPCICLLHCTSRRALQQTAVWQTLPDVPDVAGTADAKG